MTHEVFETHQVRWWVWTVLLALAMSATQSVILIPFFLGLLFWIVRRVARVQRHTFSMLVGLIASILLLRIMFQMFFGIPVGNTILFRLPEIDILNVGLRIGGIFTLESLQTAAREAITLGGIIVALLASSMMIPVSSLVRRLPSGFSNVALVLSIALSFLPQLLKDVKRNLRANRWRGHSKPKLGVLATNLVNVVENALEKSIQLSASMWRRGLGSDNEWRSNSLGLFGTILFLSGYLIAFLFKFHVSLLLLGLLGLALVAYSLGTSVTRPITLSVADVNKSSFVVLSVALAVVGIWLTDTLSVEFLLFLVIASLSWLLVRANEVQIRHA